MGWFLSGTRSTLRADRGIVLVFNLKQACVELSVFTVDQGSDLLVRGVWGGGGAAVGYGGMGTITIPDPVSDILINSNQFLLSYIFWGIGGGWGNIN